MPADLRTRVGHLDLPSPILTASGCAGTGRELAQFTDVARIGAIITKSVTLEPKAGNPSPRMTETFGRSRVTSRAASTARLKSTPTMRCAEDSPAILR